MYGFQKPTDGGDGTEHRRRRQSMNWSSVRVKLSDGGYRAGFCITKRRT